MLKYSLPWAAAVVKTYANDHARALEFFTKQTRMSTKNLAICLAANDGTWDKLKSLISKVEKLEIWRLKPETATQMLRKMCNEVKIPRNASGCGTLTDWILQLDLESGI